MISKPLGWVGLALAFAVPLLPSQARAETKLAVIDMTRAINETNEGARATLTLKSLFEKRQVDLDAKQTGLLKEKSTLERQCKGSVSRSDCDKGQEELQKKLFDLQQLMTQYQQEIQKKQGEATQPIFAKMLRIVERIAKTKSYDIVLDRTAAHFQRAELDVTEAAISAYNADTPNIAPLSAAEKAALAAPAPLPSDKAGKKPDAPVSPKKK